MFEKAAKVSVKLCSGFKQNNIASRHSKVFRLALGTGFLFLAPRPILFCSCVPEMEQTGNYCLFFAKRDCRSVARSLGELPLKGIEFAWETPPFLKPGSLAMTTDDDFHDHT